MSKIFYAVYIPQRIALTFFYRTNALALVKMYPLHLLHLEDAAQPFIMRSIWMIGALLWSTLTALAQPPLEFTPLDSTFIKPLGLVSRGDSSDTVYILEKDGAVLGYNTVTHMKDTFLNLRQRVFTTGEGGLLGAAFHPSLDSNYFYILYTVPGRSQTQPVTIALSRYGFDDMGTVDTSSEVVLLTIDKPDISQSGGGVAFGPDGYLYLGTGDGGGRFDVYENGQNPMSLLGKILRINVDTTAAEKKYAIPPGNPFVSSQDTLPEIWSLGLRNPFRISFDERTGDLWISDKANSYWQEINFQPAGNDGGQNYGWNCQEGFEASTPASPRFCGSDTVVYDTPLLVYGREDDRGFRGGSVTGGTVYYGPDTALQGYYIFGDFFAQRLFLYRPGEDPKDSVRIVPDVPYLNLTSFGTGNDGTLYAVGYGGTVHRIGIAKPGENPVSIASPIQYSLEVYPNPASRQVTVVRPPSMQDALRARLIDRSGRQVHTWTNLSTFSSHLQLDLPALPSGLFTLVLSDCKQQAITRIAIR